MAEPCRELDMHSNVLHTDNANAYDYTEHWRGKWWLKRSKLKMCCAPRCAQVQERKRESERERARVRVVCAFRLQSPFTVDHAIARGEKGLNMCFSYVNVFVYTKKERWWYNARKSVSEFRHFLPFQCKYVITIMACRYTSSRCARFSLLRWNSIEYWARATDRRFIYL